MLGPRQAGPGGSRDLGLLGSGEAGRGWPELTKPVSLCLVPRALKAPEVTKEKRERLARGD